jgi:hypothetical protein
LEQKNSLGKIIYQFKAVLWKQKSTGSWHFFSLPIIISNEIRLNHKWQEEGWGRLKIEARIKNNSWKTSIWFDTKRNTYLLPIKWIIRSNENLKENDSAQITIMI